jgi:tetratricopeptide (TPR) repeat protein
VSGGVLRVSSGGVSLGSSSSSESIDEVDALDGPVDVLPTGTVVGRYVVLQLLGHGAAGLVYAAYDGELDRKLALKFLRFRGDSDAVREASHRLRREAQAMARLSHPNVVSIHDVGRASGHMFLVMDFVPGGTLKQWLAQPRPWRERLELLCKAGDGLAAAHSAGVVHRDFKPSNVLVDGDQPRVTDFGIAAAEQSSPGSLAAPLPAAAPHLVDPHAAGETLHTKGVLGTIGYLAPEQAYQTQIDARSDQFSFCVTLYQALYGVLPFPAGDLISYIESIGRGTIARPPPEARIPRSVHAAILRGLSEDPDGRFPSMNALLVELRRDREREARRRWTLWGALTIGLVLLGVFARSRRDERASLCPEPDEALGGAWTPALHDRIGALFATAAPYGEASYAALSEGISRYAGAVAHMRKEACEAGRVRGTQSESVMTLRLQCLDERARELGTFVQLLTSSDQKLVVGAAESLGKLSSVAECGDVSALTAPTPPPTPAIAASVAEMRAELAEIRALESIGRFAPASERAGVAVTRAESLGYAPVLAEARYAQGRALLEEGRHELAEKAFRAAIDTADEGKHDYLRGEAYASLSLVLGRRLGHYDAAIAAATTALHVARRLGSQSLEADALEQLGTDHGQTGLVEQGLEESRAALAIKERLKGPNDLDSAVTHVAISIALSELGRFDEAQREDRRALEIVEHSQGSTHPHAGVYRGNLSVDLVWAGRAEEAIPVADEAIRILRNAVGTEHPDYAMVVNDKSYALTKLGRFAEALPLNEEAVAVTERVEGPEASSMAYPLVGLGEDLIGLGQPAKALPILERATRIAEANGLDPETMGECHFHLARAVWLAARDAVRAAALARKAVADYERSPRLHGRARAAEAFAVEREGAMRPPP